MPTARCIHRSCSFTPRSRLRLRAGQGHRRRYQPDTGCVLKPQMGSAIKNGQTGTRPTRAACKPRFLQPSVSSFTFPVKSNTIRGFGKQKGSISMKPFPPSLSTASRQSGNYESNPASPSSLFVCCWSKLGRERAASEPNSLFSQPLPHGRFSPALPGSHAATQEQADALCQPHRSDRLKAACARQRHKERKFRLWLKEAAGSEGMCVNHPACVLSA